MNVEVSLGCSAMGYRIHHGGSQAMNWITTLDFRRATFGFLNDLLGGIPWARDLEGEGVQETWLIPKHHFLQPQDWSLRRNKKSHKAEQETCMDEQRTSGKTQKEEENLLNARRETGYLGGI